MNAYEREEQEVRSITKPMPHYKYEMAYEWQRWSREIPYIQWPAAWLVKAIPPMLGAVVRYKVKDSVSGKEISIYLDCYDQLGAVGEPYWEAYPLSGDTFRCLMGDTHGLLKAIRREFSQVRREKKLTPKTKKEK